jgi:hypothetical protein
MTEMLSNLKILLLLLLSLFPMAVLRVPSKSSIFEWRRRRVCVETESERGLPLSRGVAFVGEGDDQQWVIKKPSPPKVYEEVLPKKAFRGGVAMGCILQSGKTKLKEKHGFS